MDVLVFEPATGGHHLHYVRVLSEGLLNLGARVHWVLATDAEQTAEYAVHLQSLAGHVSSVRQIGAKVDTGFGAWRQVAQGLIQVTRKTRPDRVMLPYTGGIPAGLGIRAKPWPFPDIPLEGLVMRGSWAYPTGLRRDALRSHINLTLLGRIPWDHLHILDPLAYDGLRRCRFRQLSRCRLIPEPVEPITPLPSHEARRRLGLPSEGRWLVVTGVQDHRKGSDRLLVAFAAAKLPDDARLLLAGRCSPAVRDWLQGPGRSLQDSGRIMVIDRYLSDEEHDLALNAADYMAAPHVRPVGSSGLLVRAAALRKPTLATDYGWVGWATSTFGLGLTVNVEEPRAYEQALETLFNHPPPFGNPLTEHFIHYHTLDNQRSHMLAATVRQMGKPQPSGVTDWNDLFGDKIFR